MDQETPRIFVIVSWGCTATTWIARALNSHPNILALHDAASVWQDVHAQPPVNEVRYLEWLERVGTGYRLCGDVHGTARHAMPAIRDHFGGRFEAAVVTREPLERLQSQFALFDKYQYRYWPGLEYADDLARHCGVDPAVLTARDRCYLHGISLLNAIVEEQLVGPIYRMEDLTTSPGIFADLVHHIGGPTVRTPRSWLKTVMREPGINTHSRTADASQSLARLSIDGHPIAELIGSIVSQDAWTLYRQLGYRDSLM